jgi:hypothetical protein
MQQRFGVMVRTMTDMATLWLDFLGSAPWARMPGFMGMPGMPGAKPTPPPGSTPAPPFSAGTPPEPPPAPGAIERAPGQQRPRRPAVSVDVTSRRRTEVILDLRPLSAEGALRVHDLRAPDPAAPRLCGATIAGVPGEDRWWCAWRCPTITPGLYSGLILDDRTGLPRGSLTGARRRRRDAVSTSSALVPQMLDEYGGICREHLRRYLSARSPGHHLYDLVADYPTRGGRSLRASLCIASARAFGAPVEVALNSAVSVEILHNAFLVHDDVEDDSEERRGRPTLHLLHGVPIAINVGDALAVLSLQPLIDNVTVLGPRLALRVLEEAQRMARESVEGQAIELQWRQENAVGLDDAAYLNLILKKTCWYSTIFPTRVGALIGTGDGVALDRYLRFGFFVGAAFPDPGRSPQPHRRPQEVRQGAERRHLGGQAHPHPHPRPQRRRRPPAPAHGRAPGPPPLGPRRRRRGLRARLHGGARLDRVCPEGGPRPDRRRPARVRAGLRRSARLARQALLAGDRHLGDRAGLTRQGAGRLRTVICSFLVRRRPTSTVPW